MRPVSNDAWGIAGLALGAVLFHFLTAATIGAYYQAHLPHYDSMGSYSYAFRIINEVHSGNLSAAWRLATAFNLSQTQALFALALGPVLTPTPASLQLYNTICVSLFCASAYLCARSFLYASPARALTMSMVLFLPDALYTWQGGLLDWQRDPSFLCLLGAAFFLFFVFVSKNVWWSAALFGAALGIALISRDSSPPILLMVFGPLAIGWIARTVTAQGFNLAISKSGTVLLFAAPFAVWFAYFQLLPTIGRLGNPFISFAVGADRWTSLASTWWVPWWIVVGEVKTGAGGMLEPVELGLIATYVALALTVVFAARSAPRSSAIVASGAWAAIATTFLLTAIYGLQPLSFPGIKHPYYPTMLLTFALAFVGIRHFPGLHLGGRARDASRFLGPILVAALILGLAILRIDYKTRPPEPDLVRASEALIALLDSVPGGETAFLWHDGISIDVLAYYALQRGDPAPRKMVFPATDGTLVDTEIGLPRGIAPAALLQNLRNEIYRCASFVVVSTNLARYEDRSRGLFIYGYGRELVAELIRDLPERLSFRVGTDRIVVLQNSGAARCRT